MGDQTYAFVCESNRIEGIKRDPTAAELAEHDRFVSLPRVTVQDLQEFVNVYQPGAAMRLLTGMNVRVGNHTPPPGGPKILDDLQAILDAMPRNGPYDTHLLYESLHPFTDGNGRSGRALWSWQMNRRDCVRGHPLGFLHHFYYQTLAARSPQVK